MFVKYIGSISFLILIIIFVNICKIHASDPKIYRLPSGPEGPGKFGAYYTNLKYDPQWDKHWRVDDHPDVVVRFDDGGHRTL